MWCNALNEFLLDTDGQLTLSAILDKGLSLYSSADARLVYNISRKFKKKSPGQTTREIKLMKIHTKIYYNFLELDREKFP